jgi:ABC-type lipoprotein export system ATPase subunit
MLQLQEITKTYPQSQAQVTAVDGFSLSVEESEAVAIRGPSGCGKTTLLLMAGSLLRPTSGSVLLDAVDPYCLPPDRRSSFRARNIGFVFQQFHLVPYLDVRENILTANIPLKHIQAKQRADELVEQFGLQRRVHHVPAELSVGEKQRVAMARAVFHRPKLLLADEPTGNLDPANAAIVLEAMREYASGGATVLIVTHAPDAAQWAHRVVTMDQGRLAAHAA